MTKALVVLSGGQDSTTCAIAACAMFGAANVAAITFNYDQRHSRELLAAKRIATLLGIAHHEQLDLGPILKGTSPLTDPNQQLETYADYSSMDKIIGDRIEKTFVPMRNALFLTLAANRAAVMGAQVIYTGVCEADNANYPDCREKFIRFQEGTINDALGRTYEKGDMIEISTPLMHMSKARSIEMLLFTHGLINFALLAFSHTAYDGQYPPTSKDHASVLRAHGFEEAGRPDPLVVRAVMEQRMEIPKTKNYAYLGDLPEMIVVWKDRLRTLAPELAGEDW